MIVIRSNCPDGDTIKSRMAQNLKTAITPNQRNEVKTWSKEVSVGNWVRAPDYTVPNPKSLEGDYTGEGCDDETGPTSGLVYYKGNVHDKIEIKSLRLSLEWLGGYLVSSLGHVA